MAMLIPGRLDYGAERFWIMAPAPLLPLPLLLSLFLFLPNLKLHL
jgi:hypothetical protein